MLTKLPNGSAVDLSKATAIYVNEESNSWHVIYGDNIQFGKCDTLEQACQELDRLIEIANRQSSKTVLVSDRYYRASDILSVTKCGWDGSKWYIVAHIRNASKDGSNPVIINCESERQGNELAREIMEQVAGSQE